MVVRGESGEASVMTHGRCGHTLLRLNELGANERGAFAKSGGAAGEGEAQPHRQPARLFAVSERDDAADQALFGIVDNEDHGEHVIGAVEGVGHPDQPGDSVEQMGRARIAEVPPGEIAERGPISGGDMQTRTEIGRP